MIDDLNAFIEEKRSQKNNGRNRLVSFKSEIEYLRNHGMSYQDIVDYLATKNIEVAAQTVGYFCRKHFSEQSSPAAQLSPIITPEKKEHTPPEETIDKRKAMPSWYTGKAKSLDDLM